MRPTAKQDPFALSSAHASMPLPPVRHQSKTQALNDDNRHLRRHASAPGIREKAMAGIVNDIALSKPRAFGTKVLTFSDDACPASVATAQTPTPDWERRARNSGRIFGMKAFGASAPKKLRERR
jgi:transketolase